MTIDSNRHYGSGDPNCPKCNGLGYVSYPVPEGDPRFGKAFDCTCRQTKVEEGRRAYFRRVGGLETLAEKTFETFNPAGVGLQAKEQANLNRAYERCMAFAADPQGWLVLSGGYGCGKTHLAAAIANTHIATGSQALFITAPDLLDQLRAAYRPDDGEETPAATLEQTRSIPLLVLDDLGTESPTPWAVEKLYQLLNHRYNAHMPTVITTNRNLEELEMRLRSRLFDPDVCEILPIVAPDYRRSGSGVRGASGELNSLGMYQHMTFETFKPRNDLANREKVMANLQKAVQLAKKYASNPKGWFILMGEFACGKTHLAAAIANTQVNQGNPVLFVTVPDLLDHLRATFAPNSSVSYDKRFNEVRNTRLLILDALGSYYGATWAQEKLHQLFMYRFDAKLPTIITTALPLESLDRRLVSRLLDNEFSTVMAILAPAYLGERRAQRS